MSEELAKKIRYGLLVACAIAVILTILVACGSSSDSAGSDSAQAFSFTTDDKIGVTKLTGYGVEYDSQVHWLPDNQIIYLSPNSGTALTTDQFILGFSAQDGQYYCIEVTQDQWYQVTLDTTIQEVDSLRPPWNCSPPVFS